MKPRTWLFLVLSLLLATLIACYLAFFAPPSLCDDVCGARQSAIIEGRCECGEYKQSPGVEPYAVIFKSP